MSNSSGLTDKIIGGWGTDGVITLQRGFPLKISWAGPSTPLESANLGVSNIRPNLVSGCGKSSGGRRISQWFNTSCFSAPPPWGFGTVSRVDPTLRADGAENFDFSLFKRTKLTERLGLEFRTEFFNLFNHPQFGFPGTGFVSGNSNGFGKVTSQANNPRLIQFAGKLVF